MTLKQEIGNRVPFTPEGMKGYSSEEILKIQDFYGVAVTGGLENFFRELGRSSGNVQFRCFLIPYTGYYKEKTPASVSGHLATQINFKDELIRNARPFLTGCPFLISIENETQYVFLRTTADRPVKQLSPEDDYSGLSPNPEIIYKFDQNTGLVQNTGVEFEKYLLANVLIQPSTAHGEGEMIRI